MAFDTLLLDSATWDLAVDAKGNIACATTPYAIAQTVSCAVRVFQEECWYNTALGLPYLGAVLGHRQSAALFRTDVEQAARATPGVASATCLLTGISPQRRLSGMVQLTTTDGAQSVVSF